MGGRVDFFLPRFLLGPFLVIFGFFPGRCPQFIDIGIVLKGSSHLMAVAIETPTLEAISW